MTIVKWDEDGKAHRLELARDFTEDLVRAAIISFNFSL